MMKAVFLMLFLLSCSASIAQNNDAYSLGIQGLQLVEDGSFEEGIKLLKKARNMEPGSYDYPFEIGRAYFLSGKHRMAEKYFYPLQFHTNAQADVFVMLAQCYRELNEQRKCPDPQREKELNAIRLGIQTLPDAGVLYLELAQRNLELDEPLRALSALEKGIDQAPDFEENYFWASKVYLLSNELEKAWLNAEIFYNMTDNIEMGRTAAQTIRSATAELFRSSSNPCHVDGSEVSAWVSHRQCIMQPDSTSGTLAQSLKKRLRQIGKLGLLEPYIASIYLEDRSEFLNWLALNGKQFEQYRQWRNWNPLTIY